MKTIAQKNYPVLSWYTVEPFFSAKSGTQGKVDYSPDLGLSMDTARIFIDGVLLADDEFIHWSELEEIHKDENSCFDYQNGEFAKIQAFSEATNRYYSLYPTQRAPTMLLSGIPMHRIKDTDPFKDTQTKIRAAKPNGQVLDTTTGLGYTAIQASDAANSVITIELDPVVLDICQRNPWSERLFGNPKIIQKIGDSYDIIQLFPDGQFHRIIHDPPMFSLAGDLYSAFFYEQVFRVLKSNGRLFHYIGDLNSSSGKRVSRGVIERLKKVGFSKIEVHPEAFALVAYKNH